MPSRTMHSVYVGNDPANLANFESQVGVNADNVLMYLNDWSWDAYESSIPWATQLWKDDPTPRIWGVPLTVTGTPLEEVATGAHNDTFLRAAQAIAATSPPSPDGNIYVRVGWEFNGEWMPWAAEGHEQAYIDSFRQLVDTFRSVAPNFKFVWDVVNADRAMDPAKAYPGDNYVDVVGLDTYWNKQWDGTDPHQAFLDKVNNPVNGLQWQQDFAAAHGKPTAISEWGVQDDDAGPFVKDMANWLQQHNMVYDVYWQSNLADFNGELQQHPNAMAAYKAAFSGSTPVDPTDPVVVPVDPVGPVDPAPEPEVSVTTVDLPDPGVPPVKEGVVTTGTGSSVTVDCGGPREFGHHGKWATDHPRDTAAATAAGQSDLESLLGRLGLDGLLRRLDDRDRADSQDLVKLDSDWHSGGRHGHSRFDRDAGTGDVMSVADLMDSDVGGNHVHIHIHHHYYDHG